MQLLCHRLFACLLALVVKSGCGRAPALPTRVALLELGLVTTNEKLTTIDTKIDNLSTDTKNMIDNLSKDTKKMGEDTNAKIDAIDKKLDKKLDQILSELETFSNSTTDKLNNHKVWLVALSVSGGMMTIVGGILTMKDATGWFHK